MSPARRPRRRAEFLLALFFVAAVVVAAGAILLNRGSETSEPSLRELLADVDPGPIHVHGLGVDPADDSLIIATHTGTYRVGREDETAELIGESRQDTMGFAVAGPNHFLGSGHPDPNEARERGILPHLGLIESRDAGRTWRPISLYGEADFHALRFAGRRVYGYDASNDRLLVSSDTGRTWRRVGRPAPLIDLVVDPRRSRHLLATTERGIFGSENGGRAWTALDPQTGLLAWPAPERLYLVDPSGKVRVWRGRGRGWSNIGDVGGEPAALLAQRAEELYVALHDGTIKRSSDGGRTWRIRSTP